MKVISITYTYSNGFRNGKPVRIQRKHIKLWCNYCKRFVIRHGNGSMKSKSCSCMLQWWSTKHGMKYSRLYAVWVGMMNRCRNKKMPSWKYYGGRGIKVCKKWHKFEVFMDWALKHGWKYYPKGDKRRICIDRKNNDGNYMPSNCRFVTYMVSNHNRSVTKKG